MDIRDAILWTRRARIQNLTRRILELQTARLAMAETKDYVSYKEELAMELRKAIKGDKAVIAESWADLTKLAKSAGRKKK